jgi:hypothetical protein
VKRLLFASAVALAASSIAPGALAQNCAGFGDVANDGTGPAALCPNVEWLKNRAITLGCHGVGQPEIFCPNDVVTRSQMARFMKRLGEAVTPVFLRKREDLGARIYSNDVPQTVCITDPFTIPSTSAASAPAFPRTAIVSPLLNVFTADGGMEIEARVVYSVEPTPTVWQPAPGGYGYAYGTLYAAFTPPDDVSLRPLATIDLNVGTTYRFAVQGLRKSGSGQTANTYCENLVQIVNRNGTSSPFDAPSNALPPGRGM